MATRSAPPAHKVTLRVKSTGKTVEVWPVDAREYLAHPKSDYEIVSDDELEAAARKADPVVPAELQELRLVQEPIDETKSDDELLAQFSAEATAAGYTADASLSIATARLLALREGISYADATKQLHGNAAEAAVLVALEEKSLQELQALATRAGLSTDGTASELAQALVPLVLAKAVSLEQLTPLAVPPTTLPLAGA